MWLPMPCSTAPPTRWRCLTRTARGQVRAKTVARIWDRGPLRAAVGRCQPDSAMLSATCDPALLTCEQAAAAYACRWQLETCFDELETSLRGGAAVVLRSKSPPMIRQEIYVMLCCYQAIRTLISCAAGDAGLDPARDLLHPRPRRDPQPHQRLRMLFPLSTSTTSPPTWPSRSPSTATSSPGGPAAATNARPSAPAASTRPATRPGRPADPADQDRLLAATRPRLT
jgi:hypothetical protein